MPVAVAGALLQVIGEIGHAYVHRQLRTGPLMEFLAMAGPIIVVVALLAERRRRRQRAVEVRQRRAA